MRRGSKKNKWEGSNKTKRRIDEREVRKKGRVGFKKGAFQKKKKTMREGEVQNKSWRGGFQKTNDGNFKKKKDGWDRRREFQKQKQKRT